MDLNMKQIGRAAVRALTGAKPGTVVRVAIGADSGNYLGHAEAGAADSLARQFPGANIVTAYRDEGGHLCLSGLALQAVTPPLFCR